jgi:hypothetical protein
MTNQLKLFFALLCLVIAPNVGAQQPERVGRFTFLSPKSAVGPDLVEAYKKHLNWHKQANDQWTWFGWQIITGERGGTIVDATFVSWDDLNRPVNPAADIADFTAVVGPELRNATVHLWRERSSLGQAFPNGPSPYMVMAMLSVPDRAGKSGGSWRDCHSCAVFEAATQDGSHQWIAFAQGKDWGQVSEALGMMQRLAQGLNASAARIEVLRYRPDLLYRPQTK